MGIPEKDYLELPLTFERGLLETVEVSMLPPGAAAELENYDPDPGGSLRARVGWQKGSTENAPSTRQGWGIGSLSAATVPVIKQSLTDTGSPDLNPASWPVATTAGNLLIACISWVGNIDHLDITPPAGEGWTYVNEVIQTTPSPDIGHAWYIAENASSRTTTGTWDLGVASSGDMWMAEIANVPASSTIDVFKSATGNSSAPDTGTTAAVDELSEFGLAAITFNSGTTTASAWTNSFEEVSDASGLAIAKKNLGGGTYSVGATASASSYWAASTISIHSSQPGGARSSWIYATNTGTTLDLYYIETDDIDSSTHSLIESISADGSTYPVAFASGLGRLFYTHPNFATTRTWTPSGGAAAIADAPAARCAAFHKERLFLGGNITNPSVLYYSEIGDHTIWTSGTAGNIQVGNDSGDPIEDIATYNDGLMIAKKNSLWFLSGSGADSFRLIKLDGGNSSSGKTIMPTPYGCIIAGDRQIWNFANGSVDKISVPVQETYGKTGNWMYVDYLDTTGFFCDEGSGTVYVLNFQTGAWTTYTVDSAATEGPSCIASRRYRQVFTPKNATVGSILNYREVPQGTRAKDFDTLGETFHLLTPEIWAASVTQKFTPRYLFLKLRQRGGSELDSPLVVTPYFNGVQGTAREIAPLETAGTRHARISLAEDRLAKGIMHIQFDITQTALSGESAIFDIEEINLAYITAEFA